MPERPKVQAGKLPAWEVADLPAPPPFSLRNALLVIGPGAILLSGSIGSGEWIFGPALAVQHGVALMWVATIGIITQTFLNAEFIRYTMYTGEPILVGFMRLTPGPAFWGSLYVLVLLLSFGWPGWAGGSAGVLFALVTGRLPDPSVAGDRETQTLIASGLFLACVAFLAFGGKVIERGLEILSWLIVVFIFLFLLAVDLLFAPSAVWVSTLKGFFSFGTLPSGTDYLLLGALAAYAAAGGISNCVVSDWYRDKGIGMGKLVGYIPSMIGGREVRLPNVGKVFTADAENTSRFKLWWKYAALDQYGLYGPGAFVGMFLCVLLAVAVIPAGTKITGLAIGAYQAHYLSEAAGRALWYLTLLNGFWILFGTQLNLVDLCVRTSTNMAWAGSPRLRSWARGDPRRLYYPLLLLFVAWGSAALHMAPPYVLLQVQANISAFVMALISVQVLILNRKFLPREIASPWWQASGVIVNALFYALISGMILGRWLKLW